MKQNVRDIIIPDILRFGLSLSLILFNEHCLLWRMSPKWSALFAIERFFIPLYDTSKKRSRLRLWDVLIRADNRYLLTTYINRLIHDPKR